MHQPTSNPHLSNVLVEETASNDDIELEDEVRVFLDNDG